MKGGRKKVDNLKLFFPLLHKGYYILVRTNINSPLEGSPDEIGEGCLNEHPPSRGIYPALDAGLATYLKGGIRLWVY